MQVLTRPWGAMHYRIDGPEQAPTVVFANSLGTDLRLWDALLAHLPGFRAIRFDKRGHGLSDGTDTLRIEDLAEDAAALIEAEGRGPVVFVGLSIGGMIGQSLAARRPELLRALVLSNTAAKMGTPDAWRDRIAAVRAGGCAAIADAVMERWFGPAFRATHALRLWRNMLARSDAHGYAAACEAIAQADLAATTATLRLPTLAIGGDLDGASPPEQVRATANLIPGAEFRLLPGTGHLPCVEDPAGYAAILVPFLKEHAR
ncbi:3-oxoadipate enol-lactonase [Paracoccus siganidrum]|uniref:3-oxoadipate enol-lactonase n=1 Tax=Paracoccus siganidrum TaxID=1276757 RepID=A0A419ABX0_9RHOB|nr:3-oxoadipate enol-lactonase [Paracoccus siganidrum]RJL21338.1 3-oxoadipate enol-lactonase [Paracoccus siganidrum]RMC37063.1 3-oxoadipate enol-lactonase [Paracoccus siganidrum]